MVFKPVGIDENGNLPARARAALAKAGELTAAFAPRWQPTTAYAAGQAVVSPSGDLVTSNAAHTSGAAFNAANWTTQVANPASQTRADLDAAFVATTAAGIGKNAAVWANGGVTGTDANFTNMVQRIPITLPVSTARWRLRIRNSDQYGNGIAGPFTIRRPSLGVHLLDANGAGTGEMVAPPYELGIDTLAITSDGSEWVGDWVTAAAGQFTAQTRHLLSIGIQMNSGQQTVKTNSVSWYRSGVSHLANAQTVGTLTKTTPFLDIRVEYEYNGAEPMMTVGDSITDGLYGNGLGQNGGYPATFAKRTGQPVCNAAVSGQRANQVTTYGTAHWYWQRVIPIGGAVPKAAVVMLGTNDATTVGMDAATIQNNLLNIFATLRSLGVKRVYAATITPRNDGGATAAVKTMISAVNTWLLARPAGLVDVFEFDNAVSTKTDRAALDTRYDSGDGLHLNTAGYAALAKSIPGRI